MYYYLFISIFIFNGFSEQIKAEVVEIVNISIDSLTINENNFKINFSFDNLCNDTILLFPPKYGIYLGIMKLELFAGNLELKPKFITDIDYTWTAPHQSERLFEKLG